MSFMGTFMCDRCDIFHRTRAPDAAGYGLPDADAWSYPDKADIEAVPCHFQRKGGLGAVTDMMPRTLFEASLKLVLPPGTDIREGDRVRDEQGYTYTAGVPRTVGRGHHIAVMVTRKGTEESL